MSFCLHECLRALGLEHHYDRFTSVGIHRATHLSALTMEDYPILGVCSMEDRTRLFHLIQMIKTLDLESLEHEDGDDFNYTADGGDASYMDSSFTYDCGDPDEEMYDDEDEKDAAVSKFNTASFSKSSCVRRLDFSDESISHHQKLYSPPVRNLYDEPGQCKGSTIPVQVDCNTGSAVVCSCKGNNNHRLGFCSHKSDYHTGENNKPDIIKGNSMYNSNFRLSGKPKPRPALALSKRTSNKVAGNKERNGNSEKEKLLSSIDSTSEHICKPTPVYESKRTAGYNYGLPLSSPSAPNKKLPGGQRISVCVRKRPQTRSEFRRGEADVVTTPSRDCVIVHESKEAVDLTQYILQHRFYFDQVFGEESSNEEVYRKTAYPLVQHMLNGGKATCFAYGQTGAGKTHTMLGSSPSRPGLYALAVQDIFAHLSITHKHSPLLVYVSFFEIYCGQLYDLLDHRKRLFAREDGQKVVHIAGLRDVRVDSVSSLLEVIAQGTEERTQGMSGVNPLSSRSHALLQIQLRGPNQQVAGRMWFVDLAGSERASDTNKPDRQSRMEGAEINQSLLALKECIRSLDQEQSHTPFRQSKLTQVLKDSFVGDSMTCMIANISPGHLATEHTLNTLRYADRVKELRGQGGRRAGRRGKTTPSPKRNLSNSSSSSSSSSSGLGIRGKSPPKKPKLGRQREAFGPTTPTVRLATGDPILCSTPKNSRWREDTSARKGIRLEQITPVRGLHGTGDNRERADGSEGRRKERFGDSNTENVRDLNQQSTLKEGREGERRLIEQRTQFESSRESSTEAERLRVTDLQEADERDIEKEMHLKRYHEQLQQFMPSSASSSVHLFSTSTGLSFSSSNTPSLSSVSPSMSSSLRHSSHLSVSAPMYQGLEEVLDAYRARVKVNSDGNRGQCPFVSSGEAGLHTETCPRYTKYKDEVGGGDSVGGDVRVRKEDLRPAGIEEGGRRWAWVATTETEQAGGMTGARPAAVEAQVYYNCDSEERREVGVEGLDTSDIPAHAVWSTEEYESNDTSSLFHHPAVESSHVRAPAERPLSPGCEHTHTLPTPEKLSELPQRLNHVRCTSNDLQLPLQNAQLRVPSSSCREDAKANRRQFSNAHSAALPQTNPTAQNGYKIPAERLRLLSENPDDTQAHTNPEVKVKTSVLPQEETSTDSFSQIMDPLSVSLLQVDQQVATASFVKGQLGNSSLHCPLDNGRREDKRKVVEKDSLAYEEMASKVVADEDVEFRLSPLAMPQGQGVMQTSVQDQENNHKPQTRPAIEVLGSKAPASPIKPSTCAASMQTFIQHSISSSVQKSRNTGSPRSHNTKTNGTSNILPHNVHVRPAFSILKTPPDNVLGQLKALPKQCRTVNSVPSSNSNIALQANNLIESNIQGITCKQETGNMIHLPMLENLDHTKWRVVQAHWEQLEEMEALWHKEGTLLCQCPDMAFEEYVHKLEEIMERKSKCVHNMIAQLQPHLKFSHNQANKHNQ